ncbi:MAG: hypothetical protein FWF41_05370 [Betaproteobacteria bacterium]|nr:hypothetical protein [Betaproteobacteria bacterium]
MTHNMGSFEIKRLNNEAKLRAEAEMFWRKVFAFFTGAVLGAAVITIITTIMEKQ